MADDSARDPFGIFYGWWRGDPLPPLEPTGGLTIERLDDEQTTPDIETLDPSEASSLRQQQHRLYVARIGGEGVGYGWAATRTASIGELGVAMRLAHGERYLWGFTTLSAWRGRGIYPSLIRAMLMTEASSDRFWIGHDIGNAASARGILKAGFSPVGEAYRGPDGVLHYARSGDNERARAAQALLGLPS